MPVSSICIPERDLIYVKIWGEFHLADMGADIGRALAFSEFNTNMNVLQDMRLLDMAQFDYDGLLQAYTLAAENFARIGWAPETAMLVADPSDAKKTGIYEDIADLWRDFPVATFLDEASAIAHLGRKERSVRELFEGTGRRFLAAIA